MKRRNIILIFICLLTLSSYEQTACVSSGANISGSSGNLVFSVGQISYKTHRNSADHSVSEGVLQAYENSELNQWQGDDPTHPTNWGTAENWSYNSIPSTEDVLITNVAHQPHIAINSQANCNHLNIASGSSLTIESTQNGTGSLIVGGSSTINNQSKIIACRFLSEEKYHYISTPIVYQNTDYMSNIDVLENENQNMGLNKEEIINGFHTDNLWAWNEASAPSGMWMDLLHTNSMATNSMQTGIGYVYGNNVSATLAMEGDIYTDDVAVNLSHNPDAANGFHIIGNPFCSDIAINSEADANNFLADNAEILHESYQAIYIWDEDENWNGGDCYRIICNCGFNGVSNGNEMDTDFIEMGQAFMVRTRTEGTIHFKKNIRKHAPSSYYKSTNKDWAGIQLFARHNTNQSATIIAFNEHMKNSLDAGFDIASMKSGTKINLSTQLKDDNGKDFAIQSLPLDATSIACNLEIREAGEYSFSVYQDNMKEIYLEDMETNIITDLMLGKSYCIELESGEYTDRFVLHFTLQPTMGTMDHQFKNVQIYSFKKNIYTKNINGPIEIYDLSGRLIKKHIASKTIDCIKMAVARGVYIVKSAGKTEKVFLSE